MLLVVCRLFFKGKFFYQRCIRNKKHARANDELRCPWPLHTCYSAPTVADKSPIQDSQSPNFPVLLVYSMLSDP